MQVEYGRPAWDGMCKMRSLLAINLINLVSMEVINRGNLTTRFSTDRRMKFGLKECIIICQHDKPEVYRSSCVKNTSRSNRQQGTTSEPEQACLHH